ncbi:MAG: hypothetical protein P1T08_12725 [Acidimicrobiia bacterium]|nr:hypothetical protein [Acidimicrobiia bacterium]
MNWLDHFATQLAAGAAFLAVLGLAWQKGVIPAWRGLRALVHAADLLAGIAAHTRDLPEALPVLMSIAEEFTPNGGLTLVDRITRLELGQDNITRQLEQHLVRDPASRSRRSDITFDPPTGTGI